MNDLEKREADLTAKLWQQINRVEARLRGLRNVLQQAGPGDVVTSVADTLVMESVNLMELAAKAEGHVNAVRMM